MSKKTLLLSTLTLFSLFAFSLSANAETEIMNTDLYDKLKGKIIIQVESKGEAYYISPINKKMYFLSKPEVAFEVMRGQGVGIKNSDLEKIAAADNYCPSYNLNCNSIAKHNSDFANLQKGKIFLQVEERGEAWYVNPSDAKRYFLGKPSDAYSLMKKLGLGISNNNYDSLTKESPVTQLKTYKDPAKKIEFRYNSKWIILNKDKPSVPFLYIRAGNTTDTDCDTIDCIPKSGDRDEFRKTTTVGYAPYIHPIFEITRVYENKWVTITLTDVTNSCKIREDCKKFLSLAPLEQKLKTDMAGYETYNDFIDLILSLKFNK